MVDSNTGFSSTRTAASKVRPDYLAPPVLLTKEHDSRLLAGAVRWNTGLLRVCIGEDHTVLGISSPKLINEYPYITTELVDSVLPDVLKSLPLRRRNNTGHIVVNPAPLRTTPSDVLLTGFAMRAWVLGRTI